MILSKSYLKFAENYESPKVAAKFAIIVAKRQYKVGKNEEKYFTYRRKCTDRK
jgi:cation transport regulator ChaC